jgi:membrane-bound ClpP family serine protease
MIFLIFLLLFVGLLAVVMEAVLPFGISLILGFGLIIGSGWLAIEEFGMAMGITYCLMALAASIILLRITIRSGLDWMRLNPPHPSPSTPAVQGARETATSQAQPHMGDWAQVVQPLRPTGTIEWRSQRFAARSLHVEKEIPIGRDVVIRGQDSIYLLVEEAGSAASSSGNATR